MVGLTSKEKMVIFHLHDNLDFLKVVGKNLHQMVV